MSVITGDEYENVPEHVVKTIGDAFARDGFIYATNHGLSSEQILRYAGPIFLYIPRATDNRLTV